MFTDATIYVGGLDDKVTDTLLWELFVQAGSVGNCLSSSLDHHEFVFRNLMSFTLTKISVNVHMPKDRVTQMHQGYGFVEFLNEDDADYGIKIMNMIKLYGKPIRVNKASAHQKNLDVGANIFIGNLDPEVDEKLLYDTFSAFGVILQTPKVIKSYSDLFQSYIKRRLFHFLLSMQSSRIDYARSRNGQLKGICIHKFCQF